MSPLFIDLVNSEHIHDAGRTTDHLADPAAGARLSTRWGLAEPIGPGDLAALRSLRSALRATVDELMSTGSLASDTIRTVNAFLEAGSSRRALQLRDDGTFTLRETWDGPAAQVAASFARFLVEDDPRRLKLCANPHCRWAFRDGSKNRSRLWCSSEACGNVAKVRAYRGRRRTRETPGPA